MDLQPLIDDRSTSPTFLTEPPEFPAGYNRADSQCMLIATDDWSVLLEFLREYSDNANTYRSYCREVERFALWLIHVPQKGLSDLKRPDWLDFLSFLQDSEQLKPWSAPKARRYMKNGDINPAWRPFEKRKEKPPISEPNKMMPDIYGLSPNSAKKTQKTIESLFSYLVENGYLSGNPVIARRKRNQGAHTRKQVKDRYLEVELIDFTVDLLYAHQKKATKASKKEFPFIRARYIIQLLAGTGLRISEAASHTMGDINIDSRKEKWTLDIIGKGDKPRSIRFLPDLVMSTREFREGAGLSSTPLHRDPTPLIPRENGRESISDRRIDQILKWAFNLAVQAKIDESNSLSSNKVNPHFASQANEKRGDLLRDASILSKASAHWLRHSHATYYLKKTGDLKDTMDRLGHADVGTTMIYQHVVDDVD